MLRDLHAVLRGFPGPLPVLAPLQDIPAYLARPQTRLDARQKSALATAYARLTAELDPAAPAQPLHGDAGAGNLMATGQGWVWHDFEDTCSGPVAWDLAASTASPYQDGAPVLAAYGDAGRRRPAGRLRAAAAAAPDHLVLPVRRAPARTAARAAELLAGWPPAEAAPAAAVNGRRCGRTSVCARGSG